MGSLLWLVIALLQVRRMAAYVGSAGTARLRGLDDLRVQGLHSYLAGGFFVLALRGGLAVSALGAVLSGLAGDRLPVLGWVLAAAGLVAAAVLRGRTGDAVGREMSARGLAPLEQDDGRRRARRQRLFALVAVVGFVVGLVVEFSGERSEQDPVIALGSVALLIGFLALAALAWTTVWVLGDESPDLRRT